MNTREHFADHYYDNAAERIANQAKVGPGSTAEDRDTGHRFQRTATGWNQIGAGGTAFMHDSGPAGYVETRTVIFNAEADGVAYTTGTLAIVVGNIATLSGFAAGKKRARLTYHAEGGVLPYVSFVFATLNPGDIVAAAANLSLLAGQSTSSDPSVVQANTFNVDDAKRVLSQDQNVVEWDLQQSNTDVTEIYLVGLQHTGVGAGLVMVSAEVW